MRQERAYRRGTVAGLSLGEVFILLSFVLVLAVLLISIDFRRESASESVEPTDTNSIERPDPDLIQTLIAERDALRALVLELEDQLRKLKEGFANEIEILNDIISKKNLRIRELDNELERTVEERDLLRERLQRLQDEINPFGEGDRPDDVFDSLDEAKKEIATLKMEFEESDREIERLKFELADAKDKIEKLKKQKGSNPPCWYELVSAEGGSSTRESPIYALDLRVTDSEIMFGNRGLPPGAAKGSDSRGRSFAAEAEMLGLPDMPYGVWLTHARASSELKKLADAGAASEVRTYPCKFFAKVWDQTGTGPESKDNWRRIREDVIERFVLIYVVKNDPWPH